MRTLAEPPWPEPVLDAAAPSRAGQRVAASGSLLLTQVLRVLRKAGMGTWTGVSRKLRGWCWCRVHRARTCPPRLSSGHLAATPAHCVCASQALQAPACHENLVKVGGYILGEFGNLIAGDPRSR